MNHLLLRICLHAYPRSSRGRRGAEILDLAGELSSKGRSSVAREATGLLLGGLRDRGRLLRSEVTGAPWRAARETLVLPLAVGLLCLVADYISQFFIYWDWMGWWPYAVLLSSLATVVGALTGRRTLAVVGAWAVLGLLIWDSVALLRGRGEFEWTGNIAGAPNAASVGNVALFAMWLPAVVLLVACAPTVGRRIAKRPRRAWLAGTVLLVAACFSLSPWIPRGPVFIYLPLALVLAIAIRGVITKSAITRTATVLLVAACCFPVLWLFAFIVPYPAALEPYFPFIYFAAGWLVAFILMRLLLRARARVLPLGDYHAPVVGRTP